MKIGGGRRNLIRNNTFIDCDKDVAIDNRGQLWSWQVEYCSPDCNPPAGRNCFAGVLASLNYTHPPYSTRYPELVNIFEEQPCVPVGNEIVGNRYCHTRSPSGGEFVDRSEETILSWSSYISDNREDCSGVSVAVPPAEPVCERASCRGECPFTCQVHNPVSGKCSGARRNSCPCPPTPAWCAGG